MFSAIFVLLIISILALQLHYFARQTRSSAFRFQNSEVARQLAAGAIEEAFAWAVAASENPDSSFYRQLTGRTPEIDCSNLDYREKNRRGIEIPLELTTIQTSNMEVAAKFSISATARIIDFRDCDMSGGRYHGQEGVGTLELRVVVEPRGEYKNALTSACTMTRHHDYKVIAIVAGHDNSRQRGHYVGSYVLDYALFLRNGQAEFESSAGNSLNPVQHRLIITQGSADPQSFGKVFFGSRRGKHVYLNIDGDRMHFVPTPHQKEFYYNPADQQLFRLLPAFYRKLVKLASALFPAIKLSYGNFVMTGFSADFIFERLPLCDKDLKATEAQKDLLAIRNALTLGCWPEPEENPAKSVGAGILIEPEKKLAQILEGDVRQRFMHIASLFVDFAEARIYAGESTESDLDSRRIDDKEILEKYSPQKFVCFDPLKFRRFKPDDLDASYLRSHIYRELREDNLFSSLDSNHAYQLPPVASLPWPALYLRRSEHVEDPSLAAVPFAHINLWARQRLTRQQLEEFDIYNPRLKKLKLRGIVYCREPVVLGEEGEIEVSGCGVLIAPGIRIESGIKKATGSETVCVLATRGQPIQVNTADRIEASLVSMGILDRNGQIRVSRRLDLFGALAADQLALERWAPEVEHRITYDPALKRAEDLYQVNISRWTTFERFLERDE